MVATYPFYRPAMNPVSGPAHEQFAIGSCIYTIRTGEMPYGAWQTREEFMVMHNALLQGKLPPTDGDSVLGHVVSACWHSGYDTMADVEAVVGRAVGETIREDDTAACLSSEEHAVYVRKCEEFLA